MKIESIDSKKIKFVDGREYEFLESNPPPPSWTTDDDYYIDERGNEKGIKRTVVINRSKKDQERVVSYLRGGISKEQIIEINKSLKDYPNERLGLNLRIEKLLEDARIQLEDGSVWQLSGYANKDECEWEERQVVSISKGSSGLDVYYMENLKINRHPFIVKFLGFQQ